MSIGFTIVVEHFDDLERFLVDCSNNKLNHVVITYSKCKKNYEIDKVIMSFIQTLYFIIETYLFNYKGS